MVWLAMHVGREQRAYSWVLRRAGGLQGFPGLSVVASYSHGEKESEGGKRRDRAKWWQCRGERHILVDQIHG